MNNIRELSHFVLPLNEEEVGTARDALQLLVNRTENVYEVHCTVDADNASSKIDDHALSSTLYYIAQEAVNNAITHGKADAIDIELSVNEESLHLTITDNGRGYNPDEAGNGEGINIMKYRAELLNGSLGIESLPDSKGTVVHCHLPMTKVNND
ncbi:MAG: ATP-binding protein [Fodinibius sp.]|nr:ATP-binding protein [Fodinibius sp.]